MDDRQRRALAVYREMLSELLKDCEDAIDEGQEDDLAHGLAEIYNNHLLALQRLISEYVPCFGTVDADDMDSDGAVRLVRLQTRQLLATIRAAETLSEGGDPDRQPKAPARRGGGTNAPEDSASTEAVMAVLKQVEKGEITPDEASRRIDAIKSGCGEAQPPRDNDQTADEHTEF